MLHADIERRLRPTRSRLFDASLATARHESAHAICGVAAGGTVTRMAFGRNGAAVCEVSGLGDCWHHAVFLSAGRVSDQFFGEQRRRGVTQDDRDAAEAVLRFWSLADLDRILDLAEAAALGIIRRNEAAVRELAFRFYHSRDGELQEDAIMEALDGFVPLGVVPPAPMPAGAELYIRGASGDVVGRVEKCGGRWRAFDTSGRFRGAFGDSHTAGRAL